MTNDTRVMKGPSMSILQDLNWMYRTTNVSWEVEIRTCLYLLCCEFPRLHYLKGKRHINKVRGLFVSIKTELKKLNIPLGLFQEPEREPKPILTYGFVCVCVQHLESFNNPVWKRFILTPDLGTVDLDQVSRHLGIAEKSNERTGTSTVRLGDVHMAKLLSSGARGRKREKKGAKSNFVGNRWQGETWKSHKFNQENGLISWLVEIMASWFNMIEYAPTPKPVWRNTCWVREWTDSLTRATSPTSSSRQKKPEKYDAPEIPQIAVWLHTISGEVMEWAGEGFFFHSEVVSCFDLFCLLCKF